MNKVHKKIHINLIIGNDKLFHGNYGGGSGIIGCVTSASGKSSSPAPSESGESAENPDLFAVAQVIKLYFVNPEARPTRKNN
jgi:hypothetical protein